MAGPHLTPEEIRDWPVSPLPPPGTCRKSPLKEAVNRVGLDGPTQIAGHHFAMGCVALEITQRCNLDCSACYLSDHSEAVHDLPLEEIFRRIDRIAVQYGPNTNVQVTGGDPTLRKRDELIAIVKHLAKRDLRPALFTNGIKASRSLLSDLKNAGLKDVAFHVDLTQERKGFDTEISLNAVREDYLDRARGLGLQILFNTTVFPGNVDEVPGLVEFFSKHARDIHLASFQLIADTGRGTERARTDAITVDRVRRLIEDGVGTSLQFDVPRIGHPDCNSYAKVAFAGNRRVAAFETRDLEFLQNLLVETRSVFLSRHQPLKSALRLAAHCLFRRPALFGNLLAYVGRKVRALLPGLVSSGGRVHLTTFYIHNFMPAEGLEKDRCEACAFFTITRDGPISMCVHNAKRDSFILQDVRLNDGSTFIPLGGAGTNDPSSHPLKRLKGRIRAEKDASRKNRVPIVNGRIGQMETARRKKRLGTFAAEEV
ncbi:MAG: radical SAM protein [Pseudomonadota bacterium]